VHVLTGGVQGGQQFLVTKIGVHREHVAQSAHSPIGAAGHPESVLVGGDYRSDLDQSAEKLALRGAFAGLPLGAHESRTVVSELDRNPAHGGHIWTVD
jgi:hypothetical protein